MRRDLDGRIEEEKLFPIAILLIALCCRRFTPFWFGRDPRCSATRPPSGRVCHLVAAANAPDRMVTRLRADATQLLPLLSRRPTARLSAGSRMESEAAIRLLRPLVLRLIPPLSMDPRRRSLLALTIEARAPLVLGFARAPVDLVYCCSSRLPPDCTIPPECMASRAVGSRRLLARSAHPPTEAEGQLSPTFRRKLELRAATRFGRFHLPPTRSGEGASGATDRSNGRLRHVRSRRDSQK